MIALSRVISIFCRNGKTEGDIFQHKTGHYPYMRLWGCDNKAEERVWEIAALNTAVEKYFKIRYNVDNGIIKVDVA